MASKHLPNYLRAHRKRLALSQEALGYLIGNEGATKVCRCERFTSEPDFRMALACHIVFQVPIPEIFAGTYDEVVHEIAARAVELLKVLQNRKTSWRTEPQRKILTDLISLKKGSKK